MKEINLISQDDSQPQSNNVNELSLTIIKSENLINVELLHKLDEIFQAYVDSNNIGYTKDFNFDEVLRKHESKSQEIFNYHINYRTIHYEVLFKDEVIIGKFYEKGFGIDKNYDEAFKWYMKASQSDDTNGHFEVGNCYYQGNATEKNNEKAIKFIQFAVNNGLNAALYKLADCYENGLGIQVNHFKAFELYKKSAENGFIPSQYELAINYKNGRGVQENKVRALEWYRLYQKNGAYDVSNDIKNIETELENKKSLIKKLVENLIRRREEERLKKDAEWKKAQKEKEEHWYQTAIEKLEINEVTYRKFGKKERIGYGGSGLVFKTTYKPTGIVAIKELNIMDDDETCTKPFINELKIHRRADNERIIQFYGISRNVNERLYYLVLEYANQGNLREFIKKKNSLFEFKWNERVRLATQIAEGLHYLHMELNFAHRDLHTKNILMHNGNVKIADFGLSKNLNSTMTSNNKTVGILPFIDRQKVINRNFILDKRSDIYSLGMVLWEISSCCVPFVKEDFVNLALDICHGLQEKPVKGTPIDYIKLYTDCWKLDPDSRPLIDQVLSQLQAISFESVFEDSDENLDENLDTNPLDTKNSISGQSMMIPL